MMVTRARRSKLANSTNTNTKILQSVSHLVGAGSKARWGMAQQAKLSTVSEEGQAVH